MKAIILRLTPNSRFHLGKALTDRNTALTETDCRIHSDTLFSVLVNNLAEIRPKEEVEKFVSAFKENKIRISSSCYCLKHDKQSKYIFLLPTPVTAHNLIDIDDYRKIKEIKKIQFICPSTIKNHPEEWKYNHNLALDLDENLLPNIRLFDNDMAIHVGVHQADEKAQGPFNIKSIQIADLSEYGFSVHFYLLYECDNEYKDNFELSVKMIKYNGIGGKRSSGYGNIDDVEFCEIEDDLFNSNGDGDTIRMSLSKVIPSNKDQLNQFIYYTYSDRGGRNSKDGILKTVRMIDEGAIICNSKCVDIIGDIVDLHQGCPYNRYGKCFSIPIPSFYNIKI
jgi:CRISPR-associated protein Csm4